MKRRSTAMPTKWKIDVRAKNVTVNPAITHSVVLIVDITDDVAAVVDASVIAAAAFVVVVVVAVAETVATVVVDVVSDGLKLGENHSGVL